MFGRIKPQYNAPSSQVRRSARHDPIPTSQGPHPHPFHSSAVGDPTTLGETNRHTLNAANGDAEDDADDDNYGNEEEKEEDENGLIRTMMAMIAMMMMSMTMMTMTVAPRPQRAARRSIHVDWKLRPSRGADHKFLPNLSNIYFPKILR